MIVATTIVTQVNSLIVNMLLQRSGSHIRDLQAGCMCLRALTMPMIGSLGIVVVLMLCVCVGWMLQHRN